MPDKNPLDYQSPKPSSDDPMDTGVNKLWWVRLANRRRKRSLKPTKLRLLYWIVMLTLIGLLLLYIRHMLAPYNGDIDLMKK